MIWSLLSSAVPDVSGLAPGEPLPVCPKTPNCVCSEDGTPEARRVEPLPVHGDPAAAWGVLKAVIREDLGGKLRSDTGTVLHAVVRTLVLRFPDDLLARRDDEGGVIHLRSASRVGRSDLGTNRRRVDKLRTAYLKRLGASDE
ncbi:DUF1499 domain-containing protein [Alienimonas californiensis]|uniref:DUF1499 domain-containing protein n=1 Tax=Alienimonas californiensis TaxID=2527989 RepID=A0A517P3R0_9PLAN|nr:DUF1499 domain-containing protein [Alienimonas californiensis]QDT14010.1 hypothetical protein CA12_00780 [Alienimonas californiensis]